ncbi:SbmA/BacA-like family transporter, partial [Methylogaea oryzae]
MDPQQIPYLHIDQTTWRRLAGEVKAFAASEVGGRAKGFFMLLLALLLAISGLNVFGSYVGRDFMTAIEHRDKSGFIGQALIYVGVFAASTAVGAYLRFYEERLGLTWREWLTKRLVDQYLSHGIYYRLESEGELENPDQRIAEDVRVFTATTLSFVLMIFNSSITVLAFSGVLWSISPTLFVVAVLYAVGGSYGMFVLGRSLAGLNYRQLDKEANFRAELIHVRENADSVALLHREERLKARLRRRIDDLVGNFTNIIFVNRKLGFYSIGYNYLVQIIPALVVAPLFIGGAAPFGVIAQSAIAFVHLVGAFSLIVTNFPSLSSYTAVVARLG